MPSTVPQLQKLPSASNPLSAEQQRSYQLSPPQFSSSAFSALTKNSCNVFHPHISFIPILSFIILRNSHVQLRSIHSAAFAWLGCISLETYVLQYQIWLAGDLFGLLSLGPYGRGVDAVILTPLFLWMGWNVAGPTQTLTTSIVDGASLLINQAVNGRALGGPSIDVEQVKEKRESSSSSSSSTESKTEE